MKKIFTLLMLVITPVLTIAQGPQAIRYQAVARAADGSLLLNQEIQVKISILAGGVQGPAVYVESHSITTSSMGLLNLDLGAGNAITGNFDEIPWSAGDYYVKIEFDVTGTGNYEWIGTTQLLSVPYAFYAREAGMRKMTNQERDAWSNPQEGTVIFNLTTGCLNVRSFNYWFELCGSGCIPPVLTANAGPDQLDVQGNTATLTAGSLAPGETGYWTTAMGQGGIYGSPNSPNSTFTGLAGQSYYLAWNIQNACGATGSDTIHISFADPNAVPCPGIPTLTYMGQLYHTVAIGDQCWMRENLNAGIMRSVGEVFSNNGVIEKHCYVNDPIKCLEYGGLYTWDEMMGYVEVAGTRGICPEGWHIPTDEDFSVMSEFLGGSTVAGGKLKEPGSWHWSTPNTGADNESGFRAIGAGYIATNGISSEIKDGNYYFTSTIFNSYEAWGYGLSYNSGSFLKGSGSRTHSNSVRCIKNQCQPMGIIDAGPDQIGMNGNSTTLAASIPEADETGVWTILTGVGGQITNPFTYNSVFSGLTGESYLLKWTVTDTCLHIHFDTVYVSFVALMNVPCPGIPTVSYGGQTYNTVKIGNQCWFKENVNIGTMINGISNQLNNGQVEKYCYDNLPANCDVYGGLYQWNEMMQYNSDPGSQGICPSGWHIPTDSDFCIMFTFLNPAFNCNLIGWGTDYFIGGKLKEPGFEHWSTNNDNATNVTGFTARGSGRRDYYGGFENQKANTQFSTSSSLTDELTTYSLWYAGGNLNRKTDELKMVGLSVRCLKN